MSILRIHVQHPACGVGITRVVDPDVNAAKFLDDILDQLIDLFFFPDVKHESSHATFGLETV